MGIRSRLNKLRDKNEFFNRGDVDSSNNFFPLSSPPLPPSNFPNRRPPPLPSDLFNIPTFRGLTNFLIAMISNGFVPLAPDPPPLRGFARKFFPNGPSTAKNSSNVGINMAKHLSNLGTNTTQIMSGDRLIRELEKVIEKEKTKRRNCLL